MVPDFKLYVGRPNYIAIDGISDPSTGDPDNFLDLSISVTTNDGEDTPIDDGDATMDLIDDGAYAGELPSTLDVSHSDHAQVYLIVTDASGALHLRRECKCIYEGSDQPPIDLWIGQANYFRLENVRLPDDSDTQDDLDLTLTIKTRAGGSVTNGSMAMPLASAGVYDGYSPSDANIQEKNEDTGANGLYHVWIEDSQTRRTWRFNAIAKYREEA